MQVDKKIRNNQQAEIFWDSFCDFSEKLLFIGQKFFLL